MSNKLFNVVKSLNPKRNVFDLSHERKLSLNMGKLYPIFFEEVIPSDELRVRTESLIRFHPLIAPIMHRVDVYTHFFYVPMRIIWDNFDTFITGGRDGKDTTLVPQMEISEGTKGHFTKGKLGDYLGVNPISTETLATTFYINALPFRACLQVFNDYYLDKNFYDEVPFNKGNIVDAGDYQNLTTIRNRAWGRDYFTSALPWTQRGDEVLLPTNYNPTYKPAQKVNADGTPVTSTTAGNVTLTTNGTYIDPNGSVMMDMIDDIGLGISINDLRKSTKLQEYLERNARGGSRLYEWLLSHFSVKSDDLRIDRSLYLGGGKQPVSISEVLANFGSDTMPLGEMGGHGISVGSTNQFKHFFKEAGYVVGFMSVLPKRAYQNGLDKKFIKWSKFDFPLPEFANIGEQPVVNCEIFNNWSSPTGLDTGTWGYQSRYAEYKHQKDSVHGAFRDDLAFWHMGEDFEALPPLNNAFIYCDTSNIDNKIFPVSDTQATDKLYAQVYNKVTAIRPLPIFGTPKL